MQLRVGTQSWNYPEWNGVFYDEGTKAEHQLKAYAEEFNFVEIDATFYGTPASTTLARWFDQAPGAFCFSPKMPREITHERAFEDCEAAADLFFVRMLELGERLGPILVQLPPALDVHARKKMLHMLARRPAPVRCVLEFRHRSWFTHGTFDACERLGLAIAAVDAPFIPRSFAKRTLERNTADFAYLRLLGTRDETLAFNKRVADRTRELEDWATQLHELSVQTCYITVSNFYEGFAPETARIIAAALGVPSIPRARIQQQSLFS